MMYIMPIFGAKCLNNRTYNLIESLEIVKFGTRDLCWLIVDSALVISNSTLINRGP